MAIKIIKDEAGTVARVEGLRESRNIPLNSFLCGITVGNGGITIFNPESTTDEGVPTKIMYNVPYTEFVKSDGSVPVSAEDLKVDIDAQLEQAADVDVNVGYKGHWDATTNTPDLTGTFENGDWFYVGVAGIYVGVVYNINDIIKYNGTSFDLIPDPNLRIDDIEGSAINEYDIVVDADYLGSIKTGSALQPYTDLSVAIANSSANDSILVKGVNIITAEIVLPHALSFYGANNAEIKYANYGVSNGDIFSFTGTNTEELNFEHIIFRNAGGYGLLLKKTEEINIRNCEFYNNGWDGTQLNTVLDSSTSGVLGYDSTNTELQAFYAGSNASNGGAVRIEECRKPMIRESRAEGNLRGFRVQDCGINGGGFLIENQAIGNIESGIYLATGSLGGCHNITVAINYSAYNANNGLLCIGGINNKFSQNEVYGNWNAGLCGWGSANLTLRDCGLYDNNRSQYNGIGNTGDAKASIQINDAFSFLNTSFSLNPDARFLAEILDTQVHYTGLGGSSSKIGFFMTEGMGDIPNNDKNIIKIDDVGFIGQDYAIDLSEVDVTNLRVSLGDNSYQSIGEKAVREPLEGYYYELPFSNHLMKLNEVDISVTNTGNIIIKEGVGGSVTNPYSVNELQALAHGSEIKVILKGSKKIQFVVPVSGCTVDGSSVNSVLSSALVQLNDLFTNTTGFASTGSTVSSFNLSGNSLTITLSDGTPYTVDVTTLGVDENKFVVSGSLNGDDIDLTMSDSSVISIDVSNIAVGFDYNFKPSVSNQSFDITEGDAFNIQIALDANSDIVNQYTEQDAPSWAVLNQVTGVFNGTAPSYNGSSDSYVIQCSAANAKGGSTEFTITLNVQEITYTNTKSLFFEDGVSSYLGGNAALITSLERSGNGSGIADAHSYSIWWKGSTSNSGQTVMYFGANDVVNNGYIELRQTSHNGLKRLRLRYGSNSNYIQLTTPSGSVTPNVFQHILIVYNGNATGVASGSMSTYYGAFSIYIDGVLQTTSNTHANYGYSGSIVGQNFRFGRFASGTYAKDMTYNQMAIWDSDQSANISDIYNSGITQDLSLLSDTPEHYYEIETSVSTIQDLIGTAHLVGYAFNSSDLVNDTP